MPILSIIIPVYNSEKTICMTLDSLNRLSDESKKEVEVIVVNDGATDKSMDLVESKKGSLSPLSIITITQKNQGLSSARNAGLKAATGNCLFFLDADDELAFDPLPVIRRHPGATAYGFSVQYRKNSRPQRTLRPRKVDLANHFDVFTAGNALTVSSIIFRRNRIIATFDTTLHLGLEDWLFWIMNPRIFERMVTFPQIIAAVIHVHGRNMTADSGRMGQNRIKVSEYVLSQYAGTLTRKQKNNLFIQASIGARQQGGRMPPSTFLRLPASPFLYAKLIAYFFRKESTSYRSST